MVTSTSDSFGLDTLPQVMRCWDIERGLSPVFYFHNLLEIMMSETNEDTALNTEPVKAKKAPRKSKGKTKAVKAPKGKLSALDAAHVVLRGRKSPLNAQELVATMEAKGLWQSPVGKTPAATVSAAINRHIEKHGEESRFTKPDKGLFAAAK